MGCTMNAEEAFRLHVGMRSLHDVDKVNASYMNVLSAIKGHL